MKFISTITRQWHRYQNSYKSAERPRLYSNISKMLKNNKNISDGFMGMADAMKLVKNKKRTQTYQRIAIAAKDSKNDTPVANALRPFIPQAEADMIARAEVGSSFEQTLHFVSRVSEINSKMSMALYKMYLLIARWVPIYLGLLIAIQFLFEEMFITNYDQKIHEPITRELNAVSVFTLNNWYFIVGSIVAYGLFYAYFRNTKPTKLREAMDSYILFKQYRTIMSCVSLVSIALELKLADGENEADVIKRVASQSETWVKGYLMRLFVELESGRIALEDGMAKSHLFTDDLRSKIAEILAVESDDAGLIDAALEAGQASADALEMYVKAVSKYISYGVGVLLILLMLPMMDMT